MQNVEYVNSTLTEIINSIPSKDTTKVAQGPTTSKIFDLRIEVTKLKNDLIQTLRDYQIYASRIEDSLQDIKLIEDRLEKMTVPDSYNLGEIFKRLFIGIIVTSFLLAILRFLTNQYKNNYEKGLAADEENSLIRRFYVAYKSSQTDAERAIAISKLIEIKVFRESIKESEVKVLDNEMLKEIMSAIAKKL